MGFRITTHERNLCTGAIDGQEVLVCHQVDDFAAGAASQETAEKFISALRQHVEAECAGMGVETAHGLFQQHNDIDVLQAKDEVILSCATHLDRVMETHGWEDSGKHPADPDIMFVVEAPKCIESVLKTIVTVHCCLLFKGSIPVIAVCKLVLTKE